MKFNRYFALVLVALAACTTVSDLRSNTPEVRGNTSMKPEQFAACVSSRWKASDVDFSYAPTETGVEMVVGDSGYYHALLEAKRSGGGSDVALHVRLPYGNSAVIAGVSDCLKR